MGLLTPNVLWADSVTVTDKLGRTVHVPLPVERAALVATEEIIPALDLWDRVVGVSKWAQEGCDVVKAWVTRSPHLRKPAVGQGMDVNVEAVLSVRPQLVVTWAVFPSSVRFLEERGIPTIAIQPDSIEELRDTIRLHGKFFGKEKRADEVLAEMDRVFAMVESRLPQVFGTDCPTVLVTWMRPTSVNGKQGMMQEIVTRLRGRNPAEDMDVRVVDVPSERIFEWLPQVIFTWGYAGYGPEWFLERPQWHAVPAVRNGRVHRLPTWSTASPRAALIALFMAMRIHPKAFADVDFDAEVDAFYRKVFGISLQEVKTHAP